MSPELAALVVHDLKNELGALEALLERQAQQHPDAPLAQQSRDQCAALRQRFVHFLLLYGHDERLCAHATDESPSALLAAVCDHARQAHPHLTIETVDDPAADAPAFWYFDHRLVRMALDAAMHNATRFARSTVQLCALSQPPYLVLRIDDDGPGPDPGAASAQSSDVTGLGTALCQAVARAHRTNDRFGHAALGPRPGGGARFELWLA